MNGQNLSVIVGTAACNARCPFCVSKMTPTNGITKEKQKLNVRNLRIAAQAAEVHSIDTVILTGKGEPTLFPDQITEYLNILSEYKLPFKELQTNGILFSEEKEKYGPHLKEWYEAGLTTIALSTVHYDAEKNREIYSPQKEAYPDLSETINELHEIGYSVRLCVMMAEGYINSTKDLEKLIDFAEENNVEQLTIRPIRKPKRSRTEETESWTEKHHLKYENFIAMKDYLDKNGTVLMELVHGGLVYDVHGQNVCLTDCLTIQPDNPNLRQFIFFPDGHMKYDWQYSGATIL